MKDTQNALIKISLGDARSYFVTTARNDLGVIFATSEAGQSYCANIPFC